MDTSHLSDHVVLKTLSESATEGSFAIEGLEAGYGLTIGTAESQTQCPACGELSERMMSATGFAFKGSGFYLTDYGKNAHRDKGTPTPASPASGDGGSSKSDAPKGDGGGSSAGASGTSGGGGGSDAAKPAPAAEAKPAAAAPKKSTGE